jgi:tol-pal system protein YbgF
MSLTTEFTEKRMRALKKMKFFKENKKIRELIFPKLCVLCGLFLLFALLMAGCASTGEVESLKSNVGVERLNDRRDIGQLKTSTDELKSQVTGLSQEITSLKEQGVGALRESQSSLLTQVGDLSKEIQVLQGRFDESKYFIDKTIKDLLAEKDLQQARIVALENEVKELKTKGIQQAQPSASAPEGPAAPAGEQKASSSTDYTVPQKLYDDAQIDFKGKRYEEAKQKFEKFTNDFAKHTLAPNAYFWIGETYYAEKKYEDAILAFENFLKKFPSHEKVRAAMLKQAYSFIEIGDKKTGKVILERIIEKYPQSAEAELAEKKIAEILHSSDGSKSKKKKK